MKILKLDAIDSTNTFLKELSAKNSVANFTIVVTNKQTNGRGQIQSNWKSDAGKNLTFSILIRFEELDIRHQFYISKTISLAIYTVLTTVLETKISVKWPNDILSEHKKIAGVLIENSVKKSKIYQSVIGIGLNVNQEVFEGLPNATSMKLASTKEFDLDELLEKLLLEMKKHVTFLNEKKFDLIDALYLKNLYKMNIPTLFRDVNKVHFMGKIIGVSTAGKLQVELENETIKEFNLKEIEFVKFRR